MSDISKIKLPNGDVYDIKDDTARDSAASKSSVSYSQTAQSTDNGAYEVGKITVDGTQTTIYGKGSPFYGVCSEAAATVAKTVTCSNFKSLETGITIHVKFTNSNTAASPTLNVNSTGAKSIYQYGTTVPATYAAWSWYAGAVVSFTYDGSAWIMNDMIGNDDTKNTAGSTDTSSKIFLIGATSQAANPQTYSDNEVYTTSGVLTTKKVQVGGGSCTMEYNTTTESLDFVFS